MSQIIILLGIISHYYDYHIIGFLISKISNVFFPNEYDSSVSMIKTFLILYCSMILKPVGAIIFGRIGDIYGRQTVLKQSLIISGLLSSITAIIPTYEHIGIYSAIILLLCRAGISTIASPGTDSIRLYMYERLKKFPILGNGIVGSASIIGSAMASFSALFFTNGNLPSYAWRFSIGIGGIISLLLVLVMHYCISASDQTNYLKSQKNYINDSKRSLKEIVTSNFRVFLATSILLGCFGAIYNFNTIFWTAINSTQFGNNGILPFIPYGIIIYFISVLICCYLADIYGSKVVVYSSIVLGILFYVLMYFYLQDTNVHIKLYCGLMLILGGVVNPSVGIIMHNIPMTIRQRVFSLSHSFGSITISHSTSIICMTLCTYFGSIYPAIIYGIGLLILTLICLKILESKEST